VTSASDGSTPVMLKIERVAVDCLPKR